MAISDTFRWLHLSDLHAGMPGHAWLWPTFKTRFLEDLRRLHEKAGPWDLIVFSGDLSQRGAVDEFDQVTEALQQIWQTLKPLGTEPRLAVVPGNHDLARPRITSRLAVLSALAINFQTRTKRLTRS